MSRGLSSLAGVARFAGRGKEPVVQICGEDVGLPGGRAVRRVCVMGGVHGNEMLGVALVRRLAEEMRKGWWAFEGKAWTELVLVEGNPRAIEIGSRGSSPHADLNRHFSSDLFERNDVKKVRWRARNGLYEEIRAAELAPLLQNSDDLIDIHATNKPSEPFVRIGGYCGPQQLELASWFANLSSQPGKRMKLLIDPNYVLGGRICATDEFVNAFGGTGVCLETGAYNEMRCEKEVYGRLIEYLSFEHCLRPLPENPIGTEYLSSKLVRSNDDIVLKYGSRFLKLGKNALSLSLQKEEKSLVLQSNFSHIFDAYRLESCHVLTEKGFSWAKGKGTMNWEKAFEGEALGETTHDLDSAVSEKPFINERYTAVKDSVLLFPKPGHLWSLGRPLFWLASEIDLSTTQKDRDTPTYVTKEELNRSSQSLIAEGEVEEEFGQKQDDKEESGQVDSAELVGVQGPNEAMLSRARDKIIGRVRTSNETTFSFLYSAPGFYTVPKSGKTKLILPLRNDHFSENFGHMPVKANIRNVVPIKKDTTRKSFETFEISKTFARYAKLKPKDIVPASLLQTTIFAVHNRNPVLKEDTIPMYGTPLKEEKIHFLRGTSPFTSPRISVRSKLHCFRSIEMKQSFLGIRFPEAAGELARAICNSDELHDLKPRVENGQFLVFRLNFRGDTFLRTDPQHGQDKDLQLLYTSGTLLSDVGATYVDLARIVLAFSKITLEVVNEYHCTYDKRGAPLGRLAEFGPLSLPRGCVAPGGVLTRTPQLGISSL